MANGHRCVHCGYQETTHVEEPLAFPDKLPGYRFTVIDCLGFQLSRADRLDIKKEADRQRIEDRKKPINHAVTAIVMGRGAACVLDIGG
jgi:hypothetical protein